MRLVSLIERNAWLSACAANLQAADKISVSPDVPPALRLCRKQLLVIRAKLKKDKNTKSHLRYVQQWPFVKLRVDGEDNDRESDFTQEQVISWYVGMTELPAKLDADGCIIEAADAAGDHNTSASSAHSSVA